MLIVIDADLARHYGDIENGKTRIYNCSCRIRGHRWFPRRYIDIELGRLKHAARKVFGIVLSIEARRSTCCEKWHAGI
jgi:hypothetical protein